VVKVWLCLLVLTCTVADLPFGFTDTVKFTVCPLAEVWMDKPVNGPYVLTGTETVLSHGLPAYWPPVLPLQSCRLRASDVPFGRPLTVSDTPV
jgi:hypothetical protein